MYRKKSQCEAGSLLIKPEQLCLFCDRHWPCSKHSSALIIFKVRLYLLLLHSVGTDNKVLPKSSVFHKSERKWNENSCIKHFASKSSSLLQQYVATEEILHLRGFFMIIFPCSYIQSSILSLAWKVSIQFVSFMHSLVPLWIAIF